MRACCERIPTLWNILGTMKSTVVIISIEGHWNYEGKVESKARSDSRACLPNSVGGAQLMLARLGSRVERTIGSHLQLKVRLSGVSPHPLSMTGDYSGGRGSSVPVVRQWVLNGWVELDYQRKLGPNTKNYCLVGHLYSFGRARQVTHPILCVCVWP